MDIQGLLHAVSITTADVGDRAGALIAFKNYQEELSLVGNVLADGGYTGEDFANNVKEILDAKVEVVKRSDLHQFTVIPKRWVVERSFAWLEKCRRLWKNCERFIETSLNMVCLAFIALLMKRL